jgi:hypothetical protein
MVSLNAEKAFPKEKGDKNKKALQRCEAFLFFVSRPEIS